MSTLLAAMGRLRSSPLPYLVIAGLTAAGILWLAGLWAGPRSVLVRQRPRGTPPPMLGGRDGGVYILDGSTAGSRPKYRRMGD